MSVIVDIGRAARSRDVAEGLAGRVVPVTDLSRFRGACAEALVIYAYPGCGYSPDGGGESGLLDAAQHRAFDHYQGDLRACSLRVVGLSSESCEAQHARVLEHRVCHELWSDPNLELARTLGLPTFNLDGVRRYRRVMLVLQGRVEKTFFPVECPQRSAAQILAWARVHSRAWELDGGGRVS